ncbi:MLX-interacting protein-like [Dendronephthya gigantea]|uniref:MLX-interacting protein-like n=1 Tax=Dendronephthya gigantea TaxID=151771 RepID=UPI001069458E|nr:MLX-interacting protein-like [Dendronephthya gigantea]
MTSEDVKKESEKDENQSIPAFGVSGQFMMTSEEKAIPTEDFNPRKIVALTLDDSLARLFECLTLEYSGSILLTPKWKNFRSQKLKFAEKTRINNAIWRSWHIQFQECKRPLFCQFDNPLTEMAKKPRPVTLMIEGKYWKRKLEAVAAEYQKWRVFYKQMVEDKFQDVTLQNQTEEILRLDQEISDNLRERDKERKFSLANQANSAGADVGSPLSLVVSQALEMVDSCNLMQNMVFSLPDTLFSSLADNEAMGRVRYGKFKDTADTYQPTLDTLQPSLEAMTPVLDELIEQLESSMKGSELNWDFDLTGNYETNMGSVQSSIAGDVEPMDHSGRYPQPFPTVSSIPTSSHVKTSWPVHTSCVPTHSIYPSSSMHHIEAQLPIWTSAPVSHPHVIGYQTVGNVLPGNLTPQGQNAGGPRPMMSVATRAMDIGVPTQAITPRPYVPPANIRKPLPQSASVIETASARLPRNSSDSQLYLLSAGDSAFKPRAHLPIELQAPNLVAQLKLPKTRQMLFEEKAKKLRMPRNKSAPGLASLDNTSQLKKQPQTGGVRAKRMGRIPRNRSDSALASLIRQNELSTSRARRDSESSDSPLTMRASSTTPTGRHDQSPQVLTSHRLYHPEGGEEKRQPSQLVHEMVTHLMSKGISMDEILNKLTSMAAAGTVPQAQLTSAASNMANMLQEQHQQLPLIKPSPHPASHPQPFPTSPLTSTVTTPRGRRKAQTPRSSVKTESPAVSERSGIRSNSSIVENALRMSSSESRIPSMETSDPVVVNSQWGGVTTSHHSTAAHTLVHMSDQLRLSNADTSIQYPMVQSQSFTSGTLGHNRGAADTASPEFLPSMARSTSTTFAVHSEAQAPSPSSSKTTLSTDIDGPSAPALQDFLTKQSESKTPSGPLTKMLPKEKYREHRRMVHVSAEQKRRGNIKMGFDQLIEMVPSLSSQENTKISKAAVLKKSVDFILQVQQEHEAMIKERDRLKQEIEQLNFEISNCQQQLPETGVMVNNRQNHNEMELLFNRHIQDRTQQNPKFWIFSVLMRPIFESYNTTVTTGSQDEFCKTVLKWLNESCCLPKLRPSVLASLREIIKNTTILSDPSKFPEQARLAASALNSQSAFEGLPR